MESWAQGPAGDKIRAVERAMRAATAGLEQVAARADADRAARGDQRAAAARRGELGRDWQRIQERIDSGRTSLEDVFGGRDDSPEAGRLRGAAREQLAVGVREAERQPDGQAAALREEAARVHERLEALLAQAADLARRAGGAAASGPDGSAAARTGVGRALDPRYVWDVPPSPGSTEGSS